MAFDMQKVLANLTSGKEFLRTVSGGRINTDAMPAPVGFLLDTVANPATIASSVLFPGGPLLRLAMAAGTTTAGRLASEGTRRATAGRITNPALRTLVEAGAPALMLAAATRGTSGLRAAAASTNTRNSALRQFENAAMLEGKGATSRLIREAKQLGASTTQAERLVGHGIDTPRAASVSMSQSGGVADAIGFNAIFGGRTGGRVRTEAQTATRRVSPEQESRFVERMKAVTGAEERPLRATDWGWITPSGRHLSTASANVSHSEAAAAAEGFGRKRVDNFTNPYITAFMKRGFVRNAGAGTFMVWDTKDPATMKLVERAVNEMRGTLRPGYAGKAGIIVEGRRRATPGKYEELRFRFDPSKPFRFPANLTQEAKETTMESAKREAMMSKTEVKARRRVGGPQWFYRYEGD